MSRLDPQRVTSLVQRLGDGDVDVANELLPLVYDQLRSIAGALFLRQAQGHTLQPTALVSEAWLKLAGASRNWDNRTHFFAVAARAMRQVLTDHARAQQTERRGKGWRKVTLDQSLGQEGRDYDLVDLNDALERLTEANERHAKVVELRLFAGLTVDEIAGLLEVTPRTIKMDWRAARAWLSHVLEGPAST